MAHSLTHLRTSSYQFFFLFASLTPKKSFDYGKSSSWWPGKLLFVFVPFIFPLIIMYSQICYRRYERNWFSVFVLCQLPSARVLVWHAVSSLLLALLSARCATIASCLENPMVTWGFSSCHVEMTVFQGRKLLPMSILSSEVHQLFWLFEATRKHKSS